jgi:Alginate export
MSRWILAGAFFLAGAWTGYAEQEKDWSPPPYKQLRYDEDYTYLQDPARRVDFFDPIKYVPFGTAEGRYLSVGGEVRPFFEFFRNEEWGSIPGDNRYLLQRYMLHLDVHWNRRMRLFGQLKSGIETGRRGGPRPVGEDKLDVHQPFLDITLVSSKARSLTFRVGRQEMSFGHQRLVNYREGPNLRRSFDGLRATFRTEAWTLDAFATKPVRNEAGFFDDPPDPERNFWGVYTTALWEAAERRCLLPGPHGRRRSIRPGGGEGNPAHEWSAILGKTWELGLRPRAHLSVGEI